ncbi:LLM class flavin-dependent oxidoreductase [Paraliobacillus ryukyuensis]|uniref:LLM class flavin-dependent oxidoreductase n=1 Tax=Paraliobacillus ryukyuensis TaxID=200904 RepID=UPI0009A6904F|nr:LLM class flavin-dependent oxidoreductase [Paraliobacillus ryukyuensis]
MVSTGKTFQQARLSVLDLAPINQGSSAAESFKNSVELAQAAEKHGFHRYWFAEHHNMPGIASSATAVIIGHVANATTAIRVGSGGIMLPNHAPLVIAEQFGTLASLFPDRIDLGLGRAPGSDRRTAYALRRTLHSSPEQFPQQLEELQAYFSEEGHLGVTATPGAGLMVPIWLLGSSDFSARLAAEKGLPFAFASHFSPDYTIQALTIYRNNFKPSAILSEPYAMVGVNVIAADTQERAEWLATSQQQQFLNITKGNPTKLQPPIDDVEAVWSERERASAKKILQSDATIAGDPITVKEKLGNFLSKTDANEAIVSSQIYHQQDRIRSYEILGSLMEEE